jgi:hypothetical protein
MAKFKVIGADKDTGIDTVETITADTSKEAGVLATSRGMLVTSIERIEQSESITPSINIVNQSSSNNVDIGSGRRGGYPENYHAGGIVPALLSFLIPGLGQLTKGQVGAGILWFFGVFITYPIVIGFFLHIWCIIDAYKPTR